MEPEFDYSLSSPRIEVKYPWIGFGIGLERLRIALEKKLDEVHRPVMLTDMKLRHLDNIEQQFLLIRSERERALGRELNDAEHAELMRERSKTASSSLLNLEAHFHKTLWPDFRKQIVRHVAEQTVHTLFEKACEKW